MTPVTLPGDRFRAALRLLLIDLMVSCEKKFFRAEGPRPSREELLDWTTSGENILRVGDTLYIVEAGISVTEIEELGEDELAGALALPEGKELGDG